MAGRDSPTDAAGRSVRRWTAGSVVVGLAVGVVSAASSLERFVESSSLHDAVDSAATRLWTVSNRSRLARAAGTCVMAVRTSFFYERLTAEPDPTVVVIDLRDTVTVGPLLWLLDEIVDTLRTTASGSALVRAGQATRVSVADAPVRALGTVVLVAVAVNTTVGLATGHLDVSALLVRLGLALVAAVAIRCDASLDELGESRVAGFVIALLEPPSPGDRTGHECTSPDEARGDGRVQGTDDPDEQLDQGR